MTATPRTVPPSETTDTVAPTTPGGSQTQTPTPTPTPDPDRRGRRVGAVVLATAVVVTGWALAGPGTDDAPVADGTTSVQPLDPDAEYERLLRLGLVPRGPSPEAVAEAERFQRMREALAAERFQRSPEAIVEAERFQRAREALAEAGHDRLVRDAGEAFGQVGLQEQLDTIGAASGTDTVDIDAIAPGVGALGVEQPRGDVEADATRDLVNRGLVPEGTTWDAESAATHDLVNRGLVPDGTRP